MMAAERQCVWYIPARPFDSGEVTEKLAAWLCERKAFHGKTDKLKRV